jgi:hypothetical protein
MGCADHNAPFRTIEDRPIFQPVVGRDESAAASAAPIAPARAPAAVSHSASDSAVSKQIRRRRMR